MTKGPGPFLMQRHKSSLIAPFRSVSSNILSCPHLQGSQDPGCGVGGGGNLLSAPSGGGVSPNLSLTMEHSGNYSCEANNAWGPRAMTMPLSISGGLLVP
ncbi:Fc receptor-like protein 2 [Camelus dromedarius]|uniref:Fc receptor-like protein 2 n=1 Tax=Camelus dromedarius TaxID=9838 RepID=A0A5N4CNT8_CAMDR|nr:Fc receptor-like protein 2 [Camelus dromedarius]